MGKKPLKRRAAESSAAVASAKAATLRAEFEKRNARIEWLLQRYEQVLVELVDLEIDFRAMSLSVPRRPRAVRKVPRRSRPGALPDMLTRLLTGRTMGLVEAEKAVRRAGYKSKSPYFAARVRTALGREDLFVRVSRGRYRAR